MIAILTTLFMFFCTAATDAAVQIIYVQRSETDPPLAEVANAITTTVQSVDAIYIASSDGQRAVRWDCTIVAELIPEKAFSGTVTELRQRGYNRNDRKYLLFAADTAYCGVANPASDDSPGQDNANNIYAAYALVGRNCWDAHSAGHELTHALGAVQKSAPHYQDYYHCTDESDLMCYGDIVIRTCPDEHELLLDCGRDDYFNVFPQPGSYLDTHWNVANSRFLFVFTRSLWLPVIAN